MKKWMRIFRLVLQISQSAGRASSSILSLNCRLALLRLSLFALVQWQNVVDNKDGKVVDDNVAGWPMISLSCGEYGFDPHPRQLAFALCRARGLQQVLHTQLLCNTTSSASSSRVGYQIIKNYNWLLVPRFVITFWSCLVFCFFFNEFVNTYVIMNMLFLIYMNSATTLA